MSLGYDEYAELELVHESSHKGTSVYRGRYNGVPCIIKSCRPSAPESSRASLYKEYQWHRVLQNESSVPEVLCWRDGQLIIRDVGAQTIWQLDNPTLMRSLGMARELARAAMGFHCASSAAPNLPALATARACISRLRDLLLSGPKGSVAPAKLRRALNRGIFLCLALPVFLLISILIRTRLHDMFLLSGRYHGDMHLNNFILSSSGKVYLVDFECASSEVNGLVPDLLYLCSVYSLAGGDAEQLTECLAREFGLKAVRRFSFRALKKIFHLAGSANPRFKKIYSVSRS